MALAQDSETGQPLSAIDWLSESLSTRPNAPGDDATAVAAGVPDVSVSPLDLPTPDRVGLLPPSVTGFPPSLWAESEIDQLIALIGGLRTEQVPTLRRLLTTLLLAEADPPMGSDMRGRLFLARVDKLLDMGALDQAEALLIASGSESPEAFRRRFDTALLLGSEDAACDEMNARPGLAPSYSARVFCTARGGDWTDAVLTLNTAVALGDISPEDEELLTRFLDPALGEDMAPMAPPSRPSPLVFRLREAIGEGLTTSTLPRAFAQADLRSTTGWKAQLEAAERLARMNAITGSRLMAVYTERQPAASGGVWDRVAAIQALDDALAARNRVAVADALPLAWAAMRGSGTASAFAEVLARPLMALELPGEAGRIAFRIALLSEHYQEAAERRMPADAADEILIALALGQAIPPPPDAARSVAGAFTGAAPTPPALARHISAGQTGEAILRAAQLVASGAEGDGSDLAEGLVGLRLLGLEDAARRAALDILILAPRGL